MTNGAKRSLSSEENPNSTRTNPVCYDNVPEQEDIIVVGDLAVTAGLVRSGRGHNWMDRKWRLMSARCCHTLTGKSMVLESIPITGLSRCLAMGGGT